MNKDQFSPGGLRCVFLCAVMATACDKLSGGTQMRASFELEENECGGGALDVADEMDFDVTVAISGDEIEWEADEVNAYLSGAVSGDSFLMTDTSRVDQGNGCIIEVTSRYLGTFERVAGKLSDLEGTLVIEYAAMDDVLCSGLIGSSSGFRSLPCEVSYSFDGDVKD